MCNSLFLGFQSEEVSKAEVWNYSSAHDGAVKWKEERKKKINVQGLMAIFIANSCIL